MNGGAHTSPFAALSFPDSKKAPTHCKVDKESFPVVAWRSPTSNSRPHDDFLHQKQAALTTRVRCLSISYKSRKEPVVGSVMAVGYDTSFRRLLFIFRQYFGIAMVTCIKTEADFELVWAGPEVKTILHAQVS